MALADALAVAAAEECAAPALFCAPAVSPVRALSTASCALSAVCSAVLAAFSHSPIEFIAESRTRSSSGTLHAPVAVPFASFELPVADSAAPVALCAAPSEAAAFSSVPSRCGSDRNMALFFSICCLARPSAASAFLTAASASRVSFSASTAISFSCSWTVAWACSNALFPSSYAFSRCENAPSMWPFSSGMRETSSLRLPRCFCAWS